MINNNKEAAFAAASICTTSASDMPPSIANHLYENGAFMVGDIIIEFTAKLLNRT